jgi:hypothetical protein
LHFKENGFLIDLLNRKINYAIEEYSPKLFLTSPFELIAFLMPASTYGFFTLEALKGRFELLVIFMPYLIISFLVMLSILILTWSYGLKKYEAYG